MRLPRRSVRFDLSQEREQPCLLRLPREIRDLIYKHIFAIPNKSPLSPRNFIKDNYPPSESRISHIPGLRPDIRLLPTAILRANRQIYAEAKKILYESHTFALTVSPKPSSHADPLPRSSLDLTLVRSLQLNVSQPITFTSPGLFPELSNNFSARPVEAIGRAIASLPHKVPNLRKLHLCIVWWIVPQDGHKHAKVYKTPNRVEVLIWPYLLAELKPLMSKLEELRITTVHPAESTLVKKGQEALVEPFYANRRAVSALDPERRPMERGDYWCIGRHGHIWKMKKEKMNEIVRHQGRSGCSSLKTRPLIICGTAAYGEHFELVFLYLTTYRLHMAIGSQ